MLMPKKNLPEQDELVLATVKKIMDYGAFCTLDEYEGQEAFLHISEVASRWIKNIREFLHEGQHIVARVYKFVPEKNQIDLSLKRVTDADRKRKLDSSKRDRRGSMLLMVAAKKMKVKKPEMDAVGAELLRKWGDIYEAFEAVLDEGEKALDGLQINDAWKKMLAAVAAESMKRKQVNVNAVLTLTSLDEKGVEILKNAVLAAKAGAGVEASVLYMGAPRYQLKVVADDYKGAEKELGRMAEEICENVRKAKGKAEFKISERK
ncbi:Translation initiation factor 2 subunit alpha [Candidatus Burarchaeum australiense]|nr:Translation initiation factor 2 subunit alpha [Candidatus Burarchaeum australiense]